MAEQEPEDALGVNLEKLRAVSEDFPNQFDPQDPTSLAQIVIPPQGDISVYSLMVLPNWRQWKKLCVLIAQTEPDPRVAREMMYRATVSVHGKGIEAVLRTGYAGLAPVEKPGLRTRWRRWRGKE